MLKVLITVVFTIVSVNNIMAQDSPGITDELAQQPFQLDYTAFRHPGSNDLDVEIYYRAYSSLLSFHKWGERFKAEYVVDVIINKKGKQVTGASNEGEMIADDYKETTSKEDYIINKVAFTLPQDDYQLIAHLRDPGAGELVMPVKMNLKLKGYIEKTPAISGTEFLIELGPITEDSQFVRSGLRLIPSVSRIFGDREPEVSFYYEIYNNPDFTADYLATYSIRDREKEVRSDTTLFTSKGEITPHADKISIHGLMPGEYKLDVTVTSPGRDLKISRESEFKIGWSIAGLIQNDYKTAVEQLRYIATSDQMKDLQKVPEQDRLRSWNEFWKSQDPTPGTVENEKKDEYYSRLRYADLNFGHFGRDGWKTDMGMVYITYGPPDEIERHPFDIDAKPYQYWYYYDLRRVFRFVDLNGFGEYELIYPYDGDMRKYR